jgi:hypothetical protein
MLQGGWPYGVGALADDTIVARGEKDAVHAIAEVVTDRKRRPNGKPQPPWRKGWGPGTQGRLSSEKRHETIYWKMTVLSWSKKRHPTLIPLLSGEAR